MTPRRPDPPRLRDVLRGLTTELEAAGVDSPRPEAERLLAHVLGAERSGLALRSDEPLPDEAAAELARLIARRTAGEPLQHLEGTVAFRELVLRADARALIPRPETEQLVDLVARGLREQAGDGVRVVARPGAPRRPPAARLALDIGTGSGAIALSLIAEGLAERVVALDLSPAALEQARENLDLSGVDPSRLDLRPTGQDPFAALEPGERFDLVVSNPPYVSTAELANLPAEVRREPGEALAGGRDGLDVIRLIVRRGPEFMVPGAGLFLEIAATQGQVVTGLLEAADAWRAVRCHPDHSGRDRFATARRK